MDAEAAAIVSATAHRDCEPAFASESTALMTSATSRQRAIRRGYRSIMPL